MSGEHKDELKNEIETSSSKEKSTKRKERISAKRKQLGNESSEHKCEQKDTEPIEKESKKRKSTDNENCIEKTSKLHNEDIQNMQQNLNGIDLESEKQTDCELNDSENPPTRDGAESEGGVLDIVVKEETVEELSRSNQDPGNLPTRDGHESERGVLDVVLKEETVEEVSRSNQPFLLRFIYNTIYLVFLYLFLQEVNSSEGKRPRRSLRQRVSLFPV